MKRRVGAAVTLALLIGIVSAAAAATTTTRYWWKGGHTKADIAKIDAALKGVSGVTKVQINKRSFAITSEGGSPLTVATLNEALAKAGTYSVGGEVAAARMHAKARVARAPATPSTSTTTK